MPRSDEEIETSQNNAMMRGQMGGDTPPSTSQTSATVGTDEDGNPIVRRLWLMGDPFSDKYYFGSWENTT